jgi:hypothetical protein
MTMTEKKILTKHEFITTYTDILKEHYPGGKSEDYEYQYMAIKHKNPRDLANKMFNTIREGKEKVNQDGKAFKLTLEKLGITLEDIKNATV